MTHYRFDASGWKSHTEADGTMHAEVVLTPRALQAMSARQLEDLEKGSRLISRALGPDEPSHTKGTA